MDKIILLINEDEFFPFENLLDPTGHCRYIAIDIVAL